MRTGLSVAKVRITCISFGRSDDSIGMSPVDYPQALTFDQLLTLMKKGEFPGFREALIDFAPTFKYDVDHGQKIGRRKTVHKAIKKLNAERRAALREWRKTPNRTVSRDDAGADVHMEESEAEGDLDADETSFASTALASGAALSGTDMDSSSSEDDIAEDDDPNHASAAAIASRNAARNSRGETLGVSEVITSVITHPATQKAKSKWLALVSATKRDDAISDSAPQPDRPPSRQPSSPQKWYARSPSPEKKLQPFRRASSPRSTDSANVGPDADGVVHLVHSHSMDSAPSPPPPAIAINAPTDHSPLVPNVDLPPHNGGDVFLRPSFNRGPSSFNSPSGTSDATTGDTSLNPSTEDGPGERAGKTKQSGDADDEFFAAPGRYDTSSKKRVPSW